MRLGDGRDGLWIVRFEDGTGWKWSGEGRKEGLRMMRKRWRGREGMGTVILVSRCLLRRYGSW